MHRSDPAGPSFPGPDRRIPWNKRGHSAMRPCCHAAILHTRARQPKAKRCLPISYVGPVPPGHTSSCIRRRCEGAWKGTHLATTFRVSVAPTELPDSFAHGRYPLIERLGRYWVPWLVQKCTTGDRWTPSLLLFLMRGNLPPGGPFSLRILPLHALLSRALARYSS